MRKLMFAFLAGTIVVLAGCLKTDAPQTDCTTPTTAAPASEVATLKAYLDSIHVTATQDSRGFFYTIDSSASTAAGHPNGCSRIVVSYVGKLANDSIFDSASESNAATFYLYDNLILGWKEALPLMKTNATMNLYLPPSLGYGSVGYPGVIPGNAILKFNIKLLGYN